MAGYRATFLQLSATLSPAFPISWLVKGTNQHTFIPLYHTISNESLPHIQHLYPVKNKQQFIKDLDFLLQHFTPIDLPDFLKLQQENILPSKPVFLLTFDDGLREFYDVIAPILEQKGIPALCFLNSAFIDNNALFFRYKASLLMHQLGQHVEGIDLLSITYNNREVLDQIANKHGVDFEHFLNQQQPYLTTEQIEALISRGFHFGAHSIDHPNYDELPLAEQVEQTLESMERIQQKFQLTHRCFSFPFTDFSIKKRFFEQVSPQLEASFGCAGQKADSIPNHFQRIPFEMGQLTGEQILKSELIYYLAKAPFQKNVIHRV
ncbi:MAG: polysaccharide deacetylase family protein [Saprospiraceae bacterium]|nr:polysaccharide deacetylase family protein [Saprospiraceae bacterium]